MKSDPRTDWSVIGERDQQSVTADWMPVDGCPIDGVCVKEVRAITIGSGVLTEIYRSDWKLDDLPVSQIFQRTIAEGSISAWHAHSLATDRLFCSVGRVKVGLYDGRRHSPSHGKGWIRIFGEHRPMLITIPPGVWHGVRCLGGSNALVINAVDIAFEYENPDHWRLPSDTDQIPVDLSA
ncbi:MAG: dTDP-4-dehydrorhamnose 3,5-epimerase [Rhizobiaceae bacterium]